MNISDAFERSRSAILRRAAFGNWGSFGNSANRGPEWGEGQSKSAKLRREFRERVVAKVVSAPVSRQTARAHLRDVEYANFRIPGHMRYESKDRPLPRKERRKLARAKAAGHWREIRKLRDGVEKVA